MTHAYRALTIEKNDGIATVTLNRPDALNALNTQLRGELILAFRALRADAEIEVVILTGAGRAFTVGLDLKELGGEIGTTDVDAAALEAFRQHDLFDAVTGCGKPVIGAVNGFAITGGFELALMCDFLIGSPQARFADTHARVGVVPGWGLSQRLPRLIGVMRAKELSLTGNFLDADTALAWGLLNRIVPAESLLSTCTELARDICSTEPVTRAAVRRLIDAGWHDTLAEGMRLEKTASTTHMARQVSAEAVAERRKGIQARGRSQH